MKHDLLPSSIRRLYNQISKAKNEIEALEKMLTMELWGADTEKKKDMALRYIERSVLDAAEEVGILPSKEQSLVDRMNNLRQENIILREALKDGR